MESFYKFLSFLSISIEASSSSSDVLSASESEFQPIVGDKDPGPEPGFCVMGYISRLGSEYLS